MKKTNQRIIEKFYYMDDLSGHYTKRRAMQVFWGCVVAVTIMAAVYFRFREHFVLGNLCEPGGLEGLLCSFIDVTMPFMLLIVLPLMAVVAVIAINRNFTD